jgi:NAD(P)-dependent dehydrogenase (short-subunit alcohol dehydrogenase family)
MTLPNETAVVVVTGAARGIGAATARRFAAEGARVAALDVLEPAEPLGADDAVRFQRCDVADESSVSAAVGEIEQEHGRVDVLVNVAGIVLVKPLDETRWDEYRRTVDINLGGTFLLCKHVLPMMKRQHSGVIVNIGSVSGHVGQTDHALYGATKGAVIALCRALAWEVAPWGIRVNSISPGSVDTPMLRGDVEIESTRAGVPFDEVKAAREAEQALGRWAQPEEIAEAVLYLAGPGASFVTGADLLVDGGWVAR